ncbi:MAG TPA: fatty acid desaturase [Kofleriaceae bacterium]|nr:fatty acid desaturase [Kofleriaceae bacterium]
MGDPIDSDRLMFFPRSTYANALRARLPAQAFARAPSRVVLVPIYLAAIAGSIVVLAMHWVPWEVVPVVSIAIGASFACLTFVAHEVLHGGIVRGKTLQLVVGWVAFLPFLLSPRLWIGWHNQTHHANANHDDDPDCYPTLDRYRESRMARFSVDAFSLGGRRYRGLLSLALGFTVQSADQLRSAGDRGLLRRADHQRALAETGAALLVWTTVAGLVGFVPFVFGFIVPLVIGNACVMAFILTNHSLSARPSIDDPLASGLSVTTSRLIDLATLNFGLHVEHHLFPAMSSRHTPLVRDLVQEIWPERYQSMSIARALGQLFRTGRVYKNSTTLIDPTTGCEFSTLLPR